ncbi:hypothetical protein Csa_004358 [Cucumis sativus]|uniref:Uncharacterized protein n=1 Tax=Cucumis sativus TaxID=3659 RepID=A0A0A0KJT3_CUCSA|nr:hypothetical protein Csa_004358 [Cucumis sativus]
MRKIQRPACDEYMPSQHKGRYNLYNLYTLKVIKRKRKIKLNIRIRIPTVFIQEIDLRCFFILKLFLYCSSFLLHFLRLPFHPFHIHHKPHQVSLYSIFSTSFFLLGNFLLRVLLRIYRE